MIRCYAEFGYEHKINMNEIYSYGLRGGDIKVNEYVSVNIEWIKENEVLDSEYMNEIVFHTQIRFEEEGDKIPQWTAEIVLIKSIKKGLFYGKLKYLFDEAPKHLLKEGKKFSVFDGPLEVAKGKILC